MNKKSVALVVGIVAVLFALIFSGTAVAGSLITGKDVKDGSLKAIDLSAGVNKKLNDAGEQGPAGADGTDGVDGTDGAQGPKGDTGAQGPAGSSGPLKTFVRTTDSTSVANIGGSFKTRSTTLGTITLPAGEYLLSADGVFHSTEATSGDTRLMLALRVGKSEESFGTDVGTCFTDNMSTTSDREASCSTTRQVTFTADTQVDVIAFGYADDQGSADSGKFTAQGFVTALSLS